ncbi:hypothetical protein F5B17DRAFT_416316 [Nemania serpens]|nr:hypothetical protein F5B17DRAFT_416316 [Nemania serpens]
MVSRSIQVVLFLGLFLQVSAPPTLGTLPCLHHHYYPHAFLLSNQLSIHPSDNVAASSIVSRKGWYTTETPKD